MLSIGPRWWGERGKAGYLLPGPDCPHLCAGASLKARSKGTRCYTERQRANGGGGDVWSRQGVSATNRITALTKSAGRPAFPVLPPKEELWLVLEKRLPSGTLGKLSVTIIQRPCSSWCRSFHSGSMSFLRGEAASPDLWFLF